MSRSAVDVWKPAVFWGCNARQKQKSRHFAFLLVRVAEVTATIAVAVEEEEDELGLTGVPDGPWLLPREAERDVSRVGPRAGVEE